MEKQKQLKCYCPRCNNNTNHLVLHSEIERSDDEDFWWQSTYSIVKCMGCDGIQFYKEDLDESDFEYYGDGEVEPNARITTFPRQKNKVAPLRNTWEIPAMIRSLYIETIDCLNSNRLQLAAAGFRAIIEAICRDAAVPGRNLESMINNLAKSHIITAKDRDHLHAIRFMGNDSIHSIKRYREEEVVIVAHIVNAILTSLYLIAREVESLDIKPISKYSDFEEILNESVAKRTVGEIDILRNFIRHDRRIISEDIPKFESELQKHIADGSYTKLSLSGTPASGRSQQYKIESL